MERVDDKYLGGMARENAAEVIKVAIAKMQEIVKGYEKDGKPFMWSHQMFINTFEKVNVFLVGAYLGLLNELVEDDASKKQLRQVLKDELENAFERIKVRPPEQNGTGSK